MEISRREFLKYGVATLVVGSAMPWLTDDRAHGAVQVQTLTFSITDAMKEMVTHNPTNDARCYFWIYKEATLPAECPGPNIFTSEGDTVVVTLTNNLDENHAFFIPGVVDSGPIAPSASTTITFKAPPAGSYLYYDNLNAPVNRLMGLHGAFIVMPRRRWKGHRFTPYSRPTPPVQQLFDDLGSAAHWPGLLWEQGDPATNTPAFRQYVWVLHQASPLLFAEVGDFVPGQDYPAAQFSDRFLNDPYADTFNTGVFNRKAHFFTINGQSGFFAHGNPFICPNRRVGEPVVIRVLNAGLHIHSCHIHANHVYVLSEDGAVSNNPLWVDSMTARPLGGFDWLLPFMRPPDVPNARGIGLADTPLNGVDSGNPVWPPNEELGLFFPAQGTFSGGIDPIQGPIGVDISVQLSPLCYPMHDHSEASQGAQGGNYNCGLISGLNFIGDRNTPGGVTTFPHAPTDPVADGLIGTGPAAPPFSM